MSQVQKRGAVAPALNITPLIDVVFLLIIFFMIVNNIVTDDVPKVQLPDLDKPNVFPAEGKNRVIINVIAEQEFDGDFGPGQSITEVLSRTGQAEFVHVGGLKYKLGEEGTMEEFRTKLEGMIRARMVDPVTSPDILLRVDAAVYYAQVLPVMTNLQLAMAEALGGEIAAATPVQLVAYKGKD